jgi:ComF family protein
MIRSKCQEIKEVVTQLGIGLAEILFPPRRLCPVCSQRESFHQGLCGYCIQQLALITPPLCERCGRLLRGSQTSAKQCDQCRGAQYYFSRARAVAVYDGPLREILAELKYRYRPDLGLALGELLVEWVKGHPEYNRFDLLIPIPLHHEKLARRGYNQAELLAKPLERYMGIRLENDLLLRTKSTSSQNALDKAARISNIQGAFQVKDAAKLRGARVLLIDDILTTGATASEASRILLRAGSLNVTVLTLASGVIDGSWLPD